MQPQTIRLVLVRHGEVDANRQYQYLGRRDDQLNSHVHLGFGKARWLRR